MLGIRNNGTLNNGFFAKGDISGFLPAYMNSTPDEPNWNGDQSHHFAAYFQTGAAHPNLSFASPVPAVFESMQKPLSPNRGDVSLGYAAQDLGAAYGEGILGAKDIGNAIRSNICVSTGL